MDEFLTTHNLGLSGKKKSSSVFAELLEPFSVLDL